MGGLKPTFAGPVNGKTPPTLEGIVNRSRGFMTGGLATEQWKNGPRAEGGSGVGGLPDMPAPPNGMEE